MAFATHADVAKRLKRTLSTEEQTLATDVIATVTGLITDEVDRDSDWASALTPVPTALKALCVEKALSMIANPVPAIARQSLGAHSVTFTRSSDLGIFLTPAEARLARQAVYGTTTGSGSAESMIDRVIDLRENRDPDDEPED